MRTLQTFLIGVFFAALAMAHMAANAATTSAFLCYDGDNPIPDVDDLVPPDECFTIIKGNGIDGKTADGFQYLPLGCKKYTYVENGWAQDTGGIWGYYFTFSYSGGTCATVVNQYTRIGQCYNTQNWNVVNTEGCGTLVSDYPGHMDPNLIYNNPGV